MERRGTGEAVPDWRTRMAMELRRDKKKTAILVALVLVCAVLGGRLIAGRLGPSKASGSQGVVPTAKVVTASQNTSGAPGSVPFGASARDKYIANIKPGITRDLFRFKTTSFRKVRQIDTPKVPTTQPAKRDKVAENKKRIAGIRDGVRARAEKQLIVQSTIVGGSPMAIINGRLLRMGDSIGGFKLVAVSTRGCEVATVVKYLVDEETEVRGEMTVKVALTMGGMRSDGAQKR